MGEYDDIINLPHYEPKNHPRMSMMNRAAQFAPFSAVAGYEAAIRETGRTTDDWMDIADSGNEELNRKMELLLSRLSEYPMVTIEYFLPDPHKIPRAGSRSGPPRRPGAHLHRGRLGSL